MTDVLVTRRAPGIWESPRIATRHTHGTGCTLASAIAAGLAQGFDIETAVDRARTYVQLAIASAPGLGRGHGPLDHSHPVRSAPRPMADRFSDVFAVVGLSGAALTIATRFAH